MQAPPQKIPTPPQKSPAKPVDLRRAKVVALGTILAIGVAGAGWFVYDKYIKENPHLTAAKRHIETGSFDDAESALKLCLQEQPDNRQAKGLLLYAVRRQEYDDSTGATEDGEEVTADWLYVQEFLNDFAVREMESNLKLFKNDAHRKEISEIVKSHREEMRTYIFEENRLPFRDWSDFRASEVEAAKAIFALKPSGENDLDTRAKDVAAALLAHGGDQGAARYLVERCAQDRDTAVLLDIAGEGVGTFLAEEVKKPDSFLKDEGGRILAYNRVANQIADFVKAEGPFRVAKPGDLPADQRRLIDEGAWEYLYLEPEFQLLLFRAAKIYEFDPGSVQLQWAGDDDHTFIILSGYNPTKRRFICQALSLRGDVYKPLTLSPRERGLLITEMPSGTYVVWDEFRNELRLGVARYDLVQKTKTEPAIRTVTRYRTETRYNPYINGGWGGYENIEVPYTDYETYDRTVSYREPERGAVWVSYLYNEQDSSVKEIRRLWVSDFDSYDTALARHESGEGSSTRVASSGSAPSGRPAVVDEMILRMMAERLSRSDFEDLTKAELRLVRNGVYARKGYSFRDVGLRRYFNERTWYRPTMTDIDLVQRSFTDTQRANLVLIKSVEDDR
jgi:hypothetical protein